jgi:hypothetical protein
MNAIETRLHRLKTRIDNALPWRGGHLIERLAEDFEPAAIGVLIQLFAHQDERAIRAGRVLARFGEAADAPIQAYIACPETGECERMHAEMALESLRYRIRFAEVVGRCLHLRGGL